MPPQTNRISTLPILSSGMVGESSSPLLAGTGRPSMLATDHSYTSCPTTRFAMRRTSSAFETAISE
jgi:hypothetical protein